MVCWLIRAKSPSFLMNLMNLLPEAPSCVMVKSRTRCNVDLLWLPWHVHRWHGHGQARLREPHNNWMGICCYHEKWWFLPWKMVVWPWKIVFFTMKNGVLAKNFRFDQQKIGIDRIDRSKNRRMIHPARRVVLKQNWVDENLPSSGQPWEFTDPTVGKPTGEW